MEAKLLLHDSARATIDKAAEKAVRDPELLKAFFELVKGEDIKIAARAARVLYYSESLIPGTLKPLHNNITDFTLKTDNERLLLTLLNIMTIIPFPKSEKKYGLLMDKCFRLLDSTPEKAAIKIYSLRILEKMCEKYPELKQELFLTIKRWMPYSPMSFKSAGGKILSRLKKDVQYEEYR